MAVHSPTRSLARPIVLAAGVVISVAIGSMVVAHAAAEPVSIGSKSSLVNVGQAQPQGQQDFQFRDLLLRHKKDSIAARIEAFSDARLKFKAIQVAATAATDNSLDVQAQAIQIQDDAAATQQAAQEAAKQAQEAARRSMVQAVEQAKAAEERAKQAARAGLPSNPFAADVPVLNIEFPGGTVAQYVQLLRASSKDPVNVAASEELLVTNIPPISLKSVSLMSALRALGTIGNGEGMIDVRDLSVVSKTNERVGSPLYEVVWIPRRINDDTSVNTYSLFEQLPSVTDEEATRLAETLVSAAQAALTMSGGGTSWELKFHRPSRLLLVKGTRSQTDIVAGVVDRMTAGWARDAAQKRVVGGDAEAMRRLQDIREELARDIEGHRKAMEEYMARYEAMAAAAKKAGVATPDMGQLETMRYQELQNAYNTKLSRMARLEDQLLTARLGTDIPGNTDARIRELEAKVEQLTRYIQRGPGGAK